MVWYGMVPLLTPTLTAPRLCSLLRPLRVPAASWHSYAASLGRGGEKHFQKLATFLCSIEVARCSRRILLPSREADGTRRRPQPSPVTAQVARSVRRDLGVTHSSLTRCLTDSGFTPKREWAWGL
jgi:hypothetical protein